MTSTSRPPRGFTLLELMTALAILAIVTGLAFAIPRRGPDRNRLSGAAFDVRGLVSNARQEAMASGRDVAVLLFLDHQAAGYGTGRLVVYADGDASLFSDAAPVNFAAYDPANPASGPRGEVLEVFDLDRGLLFGPPTGQGTGAALPAPFAALPLDSACSFCAGRRGAVVFDYAGRARFYGDTNAPLALPAGGSLSLTSATLTDEVRTLAIVAGSGALRSISTQRPSP